MSSRLRFLLLVSFFICCGHSGFAQDNSSRNSLAVAVEQAHIAGADFKHVALFQPVASGLHHVGVLKQETLLDRKAASVTALYQQRPSAISMDLRTESGQAFSIEMIAAHPLAEGANMGFIDASGRHPAAYDNGVHYKGIVSSSTGRSVAALSVFANGEVMMLFADSSGNYTLGRLEDGSNHYVLYNDRDMLNRPRTSCGVVDGSVTSGRPHPFAKATAATACAKVTLYWEIGYGLYSFKGSNLIATRNYAIGLFNQMQTLFAADGIALELKSMYVWTVPDDYTSIPTASIIRGTFATAWHAIGDCYDGDVAHLLTITGSNLGGVASTMGICGRTGTEGFEDLAGSFSGVPAYSWDVEVVSHEAGHSLSCMHTQDCYWMTGPGGTCGGIDNCVPMEHAAACTTNCSALNLMSTPGWTGTIMSYCHLTSRGTNLANGFGPMPTAAMKYNITHSSCLGSPISATLTPASICTTPGGIILSYAANNAGTSPYSYRWTNNATTQNLSNLTSPGSYGVQITDAGGCTLSLNTAVTTAPKPGNGLQPAARMPVCCNGAQAPLQLSAGAPASLAPCQTIGWMSSPMPISNYADARRFFDTTSKQNILSSNNAGSIANGTVGASLNVFAPANCAIPFTRYYTPVVVDMPAPTDSFTVSSSGFSVLNPVGTAVGSTATLPSQLTLVNQCTLNDTPASAVVTARVSGYNGRSNKLYLVVQDSDYHLLLMQAGLPGNGTYQLHVPGTTAMALQFLRVSAYDINCPDLNCIASANSLSLTRKVVRTAHKLKLAEGCNIGTSIRVDFAPSGCTKLAVAPYYRQPLLVYPNPAAGIVTIEFYAPDYQNIAIHITDIAGKTIYAQEGAYSAGMQKHAIDVSHFAKGLYFVNVAGSSIRSEVTKLRID